MDFKKLFEGRVATVILIALVTVFAIHVIAENGEHARLDLTADNLYSLSDGTVSILEKMKEEGVKPITLKLYFSETAGKTLPRFIKDFITYESYVEALLKEFEVASQGKIRVDFIDPKPETDEAQDAEEYGLEGKPINQHGDLFFFGLVMETQTGSRDRIEFLWPNQQETVEYEIVKRLHNMIWPTKKRIGVLAGLEVLGEADNPYMRQVLQAQGKSPRDSWMAMQVLKEQYEVSRIDSDTDEISREDYDLVMVVHPKNLGERGLWALDEWVQRGGNTMVFVDPYAVEDRPPANPQNQWMQFQYKPSSNLEPLLAKWGLERPEDQIAADFNLAVKRPVSRRGPTERVIIDLVIDDETKSATLNTSNPVLQGLSNLRFFLAGTLTETNGSGSPQDGEEEGAEEGAEGGGESDGVTRTPLITTTPQGNTLHVEPGFPDPEKLTFLDLNNSPGKFNDSFTPGDEPVAIAYMVQGLLPALYPEGADLPEETPAPPPGLPPGMNLPPPPPSGEMIHKEPVPEEERKAASVLVFADVDFIADGFAFQQTPFGTMATNDNHKVLLNGVDYLFGSDELMKVRSKAAIDRPFTLFDEIEAQADRDMLDREKELRSEIETFQEQLSEKQAAVSSRNASLFEKQVQDEVDELNRKIRDANAELREIRKAKRAALEGEETMVRFWALGAMPALVLVLGLFLFFRRRVRDAEARRSTP